MSVPSSRTVTDQYDRLLTEPHLRKNPVVGCPSLVWHLAVWPRREDDAHDVKIPDINDENPEVARKAATTEHNQRRNAFITKCNDFLRDLQTTGRAAAGAQDNPELFDLKEVTIDSAELDPKLDPELVRDRSLGFTLWWHPDGLKPAARHSSGATEEGQRIPCKDALCIRVKADLHSGFATFAFYIDLESRFDCGDSMVAVVGGTFEIREKFKAADERIRSYFDKRTRELKLGDREDIPPAKNDDFQKDADFLYMGIWKEFSDHFSAVENKLPGEVFASFRGHAIVHGAPSADEIKEQNTEDYQPRKLFDKSRNEANVVLKGYWPFLRLLKTNSEKREFVACQVNGGRAIYVSALGAPDEYDSGDESLPSIRPDHPGNKDADNHIFYTIIVKERAHRQQLGRLYDRFNALGTFRMYALKDHGIIRAASAELRLRGQELDAITRKWHTNRLNINQDDESQLSHCRHVEIGLISLMESLNEVGTEAVGGLSFRISRARYYIKTFKTRIADLRIERIEGWVPYDEFARRRLYSIFDFVEKTGARLTALRQRLRDTMDAVQTSAILLQTSVQAGHQNETKKNTAAVANSQDSTDNLARVGVFLAAATLATQTGMEDTQFFGTLKTEVVESGWDKIDPKNLEYFLLVSISIAVAALIWMAIKWIKLLIAERKKLNRIGLALMVLGAAAATLFVFSSYFFSFYGTVFDFYGTVLKDFWPWVVEMLPGSILKSIGLPSAAHVLTLLSILCVPVVYMKLLAWMPWLRRRD